MSDDITVTVPRLPTPEPVAGHCNQPQFPDFYPEDETYPWGAFPQTMRGALIEICKNDNLCVAIAAQAVLSAISLACQDLIGVDRGIVPGTTSPCSLFLMTVGDTGSRKSRADEQATSPIEGYDASQRATFDKDIATSKLEQDELRRKIDGLESTAKSLLRQSKTLSSSGKANAEHLAKKAAKNLDEVEQELAELKRQADEYQLPRLRRVFYSKIPMPKLKQSLAKNWPAAGLFSDEAADILNSKDESDISSLDRMWDGKSIDVVGHTKQETFYVRDPRLTLSLMVQPVAFDRFMVKKGELANGLGFMSRLLLSRPKTPYGKRLFVNPEDRSTVWLDRFNKRVQELLSHSHKSIDGRAENRRRLYFEPDAQKYWVEMYNAVELGTAKNGDFEVEREFANRFAEHVARLSALFHFFERGDLSSPAGTGLAIPKATVEAATTVVEWYLGEFRRVFNQGARMREMAGYVLAKFKDMLDGVNGGSLENPPGARRVCSVPVQALRANCSRYELKKIDNLRPVLDWLQIRGNIVIREAERRSAKDLPNRTRLAPESVEIKYHPGNDDDEFFFDLDNPWLMPNRR
ncbi:YfjI family protein [Paraburkholderia tropica]|uniref:YfjI family protein n=1 Tax=Paraburkholderia tropica TaxID=92647 RepID=UPI0015921B37|nr:YfjI family protein [Paraburkholderia tropica]